MNENGGTGKTAIAEATLTAIPVPAADAHGMPVTADVYWMCDINIYVAQYDKPFDNSNLLLRFTGLPFDTIPDGDLGNYGVTNSPGDLAGIQYAYQTRDAYNPVTVYGMPTSNWSDPLETGDMGRVAAGLWNRNDGTGGLLDVTAKVRFTGETSKPITGLRAQTRFTAYQSNQS